MPTTKISGDSTLITINNAIVSNEAGGFRFTGCTIKSGFNLLDFQLGNVSKAYLVKSGEIPPIQYPRLKWSGQMRVEGKNTAID